jgi:hypothetical protein
MFGLPLPCEPLEPPLAAPLPFVSLLEPLLGPLGCEPLEPFDCEPLEPFDCEPLGPLDFEPLDPPGCEPLDALGCEPLALPDCEPLEPLGCELADPLGCEPLDPPPRDPLSDDWVSAGPPDDALFSKAVSAIAPTLTMAATPGSTCSVVDAAAGGPCQPVTPAQSPPSGWIVGWSLHHWRAYWPQ